MATLQPVNDPLTDPSDAAAERQDLSVDVRFAVPALSPVHVSRPRLLARLDEAEGAPLVVVSAPAGTGKTAVVAEWARVRAAAGDLLGWITFDEGDALLWPHLAAGLGRLGVAPPATRPGWARHVPSRGELLRAAAELSRLPAGLTVVLDGFEWLSTVEAEALELLLHRCGGRLRLVILTRVDPVLPLYRYRLDGSLVELRAGDLAFTDEEAGELLRRCGVTLRPGSVEALNTRLQGWAAGLRFAARALLGRPDAEVYASDVVSNDGDVVEYLLGEVLDAQPADVRRVMLDTSVPDTVYPGLAELLGGPAAPRVLALLTRGNAFLEAATERPGCYRYSPFFRDLLRAQLAYESPDRWVRMQLRAARWFGDHGMLDASVRHLGGIGSWAEAADVVVDNLAVTTLLQDRQSSLTRTVAEVPSDVQTPAAHVVRAAVALGSGELPRCTEELRAVRAQALREGSVPVGGSLDLAVAVVDAGRARFGGDPCEAADLADGAERRCTAYQEAHPTGPPPEVLALVRLTRGVALVRWNRLVEAREAFRLAEASAAAPAARGLRAECRAWAALTDALAGDLSRAVRAAGEAEELARTTGQPTGRAGGPGAAHLARAWTSLERYELSDAEAHLAALTTPASTNDPVLVALSAVVAGGLQRARGRQTTSLATLRAAMQRVGEGDQWLRDALRLETARTLLATGDADAALRQLREVETPRDPDLALVEAQVALRHGDETAVDAALARLRAGTAPRRTRVSGLLVEAELAQRCQDTGRERRALERALRLAATESVRRPFHEAGAVVRRRLTSDAALAREARWLTAAAPAAPPPTGAGRAGARKAREAGPQTRAQPQVVERLTSKEVEVLGHLAELLSTEEIAGTMFVSVNTVRTHIRSILRKLGVTRRNAAVRRARELGLLGAEGSRRSSPSDEAGGSARR